MIASPLSSPRNRFVRRVVRRGAGACARGGQRRLPAAALSIVEPERRARRHEQRQRARRHEYAARHANPHEFGQRGFELRPLVPDALRAGARHRHREQRDDHREPHGELHDHVRREPGGGPSLDSQLRHRPPRRTDTGGRRQRRRNGDARCGDRNPHRSRRPHRQPQSRRRTDAHRNRRRQHALQPDRERRDHRRRNRREPEHLAHLLLQRERGLDAPGQQRRRSRRAHGHRGQRDELHRRQLPRRGRPDARQRRPLRDRHAGARAAGDPVDGAGPLGPRGVRPARSRAAPREPPRVGRLRAALPIGA